MEEKGNRSKQVRIYNQGSEVFSWVYEKVWGENIKNLVRIVTPKEKFYQFIRPKIFLFGGYLIITITIGPSRYFHKDFNLITANFCTYRK